MIDKSEVSNKVIEAIEKMFQKYKPDVFIAGIVGSVYPIDIHGDIDVFVILGEQQKTQTEVISKHKEVIGIFNNVLKELERENIAASIFTEFRMEEFSRYLCKVKRNEKLALIHLKIYPTPFSIEHWQTNPVAKGYFSNIVNVFYAKEGAHEKLNDLISRLPDPPDVMRLEFLRSLSFETYEYLMLSNLPSEFLVYEGFNKLSYVVKYLSIELLNRIEYSQKAKMTWQDVYTNRGKLPEVIVECIDFCTIKKDLDRLELSTDKLLYYFEQVIDTIEKAPVIAKKG
jgi:hypothetical protein